MRMIHWLYNKTKMISSDTVSMLISLKPYFNNKPAHVDFPTEDTPFRIKTLPKHLDHNDHSNLRSQVSWKTAADYYSLV